MKMKYELILDTLIDNNLGLYAPEPCSNDVVTGYWVSNSQYHVLKGNNNNLLFVVRIFHVCNGYMSR